MSSSSHVTLPSESASICMKSRISSCGLCCGHMAPSVLTNSSMGRPAPPLSLASTLALSATSSARPFSSYATREPLLELRHVAAAAASSCCCARRSSSRLTMPAALRCVRCAACKIAPMASVSFECTIFSDSASGLLENSLDRICSSNG